MNKNKINVKFNFQSKYEYFPMFVHSCVDYKHYVRLKYIDNA